MTKGPDHIFTRLREMLLIAQQNGISPKQIRIGAVKTLEWEAAAPAPQGGEASYSFFTIPVVVNSETPGITVG